MRHFVVAFAALAASACGQRQEDAAANAEGCVRVATHEVAWSNEAAPDTITTRADGPTCAQAVVTWVARDSAGEPLWAFASTYYDMKLGGRPPEGTPPVSEAEMDQFLADWANVTQMRTTDLPEWRADAATLAESGTTFAYDTPFERDVYEMLRLRDLPMICYAAGAESAQCLIVDPASNTPGLMVAYGP
jgi:hypothetical protein